MQILSLTFLVAIITFVVVFTFRAQLEKRSIIFKGYKFHHSVAGGLLVLVGIVSHKMLVSSLGLGIYFGHIAEEMYFNKISLWRAVRVFITKM